MAFKGVFPAADVVPAPFGLFSVADVKTRGPQDEHWGQGFEAMSEACVFDASIHDVCGGIDPVDIYSKSGDRYVSVRPFGILVRDECDARGFKVEDRRARVLRQLEVITPKALEREFWSGEYRSQWDTELGDETLPAGSYLSSEATQIIEATPQNHQVALALLEQGIADCGPGTEGVIHMSPLVAAMFGGLMDAGTDGVLRTQSGNRVAIGHGYDGSGPGRTAPTDNFTHWMYATGQMFVVLGSNELITVNEQQAMNASTNNMTYVAARPAAVYSDGCCQLAVQVDIRL